MKTAIKTITPTLAKELLLKNTNNRKISPTHVKFLANEMKQGNWQNNGESIKISKDCQLLDGQHRLSAIVEANIPVEMMVVSELDSDTFMTIDTGRSRKANDVLRMSEFKHANTVAAVVRMVLNTERSDFILSRGAKEKVSNTDVLEYASIHDELLKSIDYVVNLKMLRRLVKDRISAFCHYYLRRLNPLAADEFFLQVDTGQCLVDSAPFVLRDLFIRNKTSQVVLSDADTVGLIFKAYDRYVSNTKLTRMNRTTDLSYIQGVLKRCVEQEKYVKRSA